MSDDSGDGPRLLSGGNPRIPTGEGPGPVRDVIAAIPTGNHRDDSLDDGLLRSWIEQASRLPGQEL